MGVRRVEAGDRRGRTGRRGATDELAEEVAEEVGVEVAEAKQAIAEVTAAVAEKEHSSGRRTDRRAALREEIADHPVLQGARCLKDNTTQMAELQGLLDFLADFPQLYEAVFLVFFDTLPVVRIPRFEDSGSSAIEARDEEKDREKSEDETRRRDERERELRRAAARNERES